MYLENDAYCLIYRDVIHVIRNHRTSVFFPEMNSRASVRIEPSVIRLVG